MKTDADEAAALLIAQARLNVNRNDGPWGALTMDLCDALERSEAALRAAEQRADKAEGQVVRVYRGRSSEVVTPQDAPS